jgi:hypothetical protein
MSGYNLKLSATPIHQSSEVRPQHIYITNDEEIKEGDYMYDIDGDVGKAIGSDMKEFEGNKKIILTTDPTLIADGIQAIDDKFLEWFVNNPSCEFVKVNKEWNEERIINGKDIVDYSYKIIIPKEEPTILEEAKQRAANYMSLKGALEPKDVVLGYKTSLDAQMLDKIEPKQETLEEAAKEFVLSHDFSKLTNPNHLANRCFQFGAKFMQERMYSEQDIINALHSVELKDNKDYSKIYNGIKEWFEQFKKK